MTELGIVAMDTNHNCSAIQERYTMVEEQEGPNNSQTPQWHNVLPLLTLNLCYHYHRRHHHHSFFEKYFPFVGDNTTSETQPGRPVQLQIAGFGGNTASDGPSFDPFSLHLFPKSLLTP